MKTNQNLTNMEITMMSVIISTLAKNRHSAYIYLWMVSIIPNLSFSLFYRLTGYVYSIRIANTCRLYTWDYSKYNDWQANNK